MPITPFDPKFMKVGVLTAALQELTPREVRDPDPDRAIEEWLDFASELGASYIQLSSALHPTESDVPPEAMLDPVANTLDLRKPFDKDRARRVEASLKTSGVGISDVGYFDNLLHHDPAIRKKKHDFMLRAFDAAVLLGVNAVCGFVGRNQQHSMDENLVDFEQQFIPLLKAARDRGLTYRVEQCPMPGWTTGDNWHNNIAYTPGTWIALHRICEKHGVGDQFRIHYDPSHAILMGQDTRSIFQYLQGHGLQLPDRRVPRQGSGHRFEGGLGLGLRRSDGRARRLDWREAVSEPGRSVERVEEAGRARRASSCQEPRSTIRWRTCRIEPSTGSITSSRRASSCSSTSPTRTWSSSTSTPRRASRTRPGSRRSCRGRLRSSATSTRPRAPCSRCTKCWPRRASRSREWGGRRIGRRKVGLRAQGSGLRQNLRDTVEVLPEP